VVHTDGLVERRNGRGEIFGIERLVQTLQAGLELPAHELVERAFAEIDAFHPGPWEDDATLRRALGRAPKVACRHPSQDLRAPRIP
jgi:serine phosphatase RsbU (regulator of sigma subunit)